MDKESVNAVPLSGSGKMEISSDDKCLLLEGKTNQRLPKFQFPNTFSFSVRERAVTKYAG